MYGQYKINQNIKINKLKFYQNKTLFVVFQVFTVSFGTFVYQFFLIKYEIENIQNLHIQLLYLNIFIFIIRISNNDVKSVII